MRATIESFSWPRSVIATLRHCSLPWYDRVARAIEMPASPLNTARALGTRDRLSLVAQFAAHHAFLQFAGVRENAFDPDEWAIVRKRGQDVRLVRIAAAPAPPEASIAPGSSIDDFAAAVDAPALSVLRQPWWRAESVYAEAAARLLADVATDLRWMRCAATGEILPPGADVLREIVADRSGGAFGYSEPAVSDALRALEAIDDSVRIVFIGAPFVLQRYGALSSLDASFVNASASEAEVARRVATLLAERHTVVCVRPSEEIDPASRRVVDIASQLGGATWMLHDSAAPAGGRLFVLSPHLSARSALDVRLAGERDPREWLSGFVASADFLRYLESGKVPPATKAFDRIAEPKRSYIAALALLGTRTPIGIATRFVRECLFEQPLQNLCEEGVCTIDDDAFVFVSDEVREHCAAHIPAASQPALFRAAAALCEPRQAAMLLIHAGEKVRAMEILERIEWDGADDAARALWPLRHVVLSGSLAETLARALVDCGRYRDAATVTSSETIIARIERRTGEYAAALTRITRMETRDFDDQLLLCELHRISGQYDRARASLPTLNAGNEAQRRRKAYETALLDLEEGLTPDTEWLAPNDYLSSRLETYRALRDADFERAAGHAADAIVQARCTIDRIDAWLDRVFTSFSAGRWSETRALALEALTVIDEAQGDRASAAILYTLAYLEADDAQWSSASHLIARLRRHFSGSNREERHAEVDVLQAHLDFCRGKFADARKRAAGVLDQPFLAPQIREAAALIVDEADWIAGRTGPMRSVGTSGNRELQRRHELVRRRRSGATLDIDASHPVSRSEQLRLFRAAIVAGRDDVADRIASQLDLVLEQSRSASADELGILAIAASSEYPYSPDAFADHRWCFATRNRLGHWTCIGNVTPDDKDLDDISSARKSDWLALSERELLHFEGIDSWSEPARRAFGDIVMNRAENSRLRRLVASTEVEAKRAPAAHEIIGDAASIRAVFAMIDCVARRDVPVCILGESGTGKELVARGIQRASSRKIKPFTPVNCAALPETLIESELFGHVRGAFTGAERDRAGLIETTDGGTLFLDEVGELPLVAQAKLLRFLQDGEFRRVGEAASRTADVRIISATNRKLESAVEDGSFREDLYYRLRGVEIALPPLRERGNDVILLAEHFLASERAKHRSGPAALSPEVESAFRAYRWPGNVRELQNTIRAAHAIAGDAREVEIEHLPERMRTSMTVRAASGTYQDAVTRFRRDLIEKSLLQAAGNQNRAAAMLNISRQALAYQIRELGILVGKAQRPRV